VDTLGSNDYQQMTPAQHYLVTLVQADGNWDLENFVNSGDTDDLWSFPDHDALADSTAPNAHWWDGSASGLVLSEFSEPSSLMTFDFGLTVDCNSNGQADGVDIATGTSGDCNGNGIPDSCDIVAGTSADSNTNGTPDECEAPILYVKHDAVGANRGTSWGDAYVSLQSALLTARNSGGATQEIWVADGRYTPTGTGGYRGMPFELVAGVGVYGGFAGTETLRSERDVAGNESILSGDLNGDDTPVACTQDTPDCDAYGTLCVDGFCIIPQNNGDNTYQIVISRNVDATAVLDGFTIRAAYADSGYVQLDGGGMYNDNASPTVANCTFEGNAVTGWGGGMCNSGVANPVVSNCTFQKNYTAWGGGAMLNTRGSPTISGTVFRHNAAAWSGGAMINWRSGTKVTGCSIIANHSPGVGGIYSYSDSSPVFLDDVFAGNSGSAVSVAYTSSQSITNSVFTGNSSDSNGVAIAVYESSAVTVTNCSFSGNATPATSAIRTDSNLHSNPSTIEITNSILWDGGNEIINVDGSTYTITYSDVQGGWAGTGNLDVDPMFIDPDGPDGITGTDDDNLRLVACSDLLDVGTNTPTGGLPLTDLDGNPRIFNTTVDMGAFEHSGDDPGAADCNGNFIADVCDILNCPSDPACSDCNADGVPDSCELVDNDCNNDLVPDDCQLVDNDCNSDGVPDECQLSGNDCNGDGVPDECGVRDDCLSAPGPLNSNATSDSGADESPRLATDGLGNWVAVWHSTDTLSFTIGTDADILVSRSADDGVTWSSPSALNTNASSDSGTDDEPAIATDGVGHWVAVWRSEDDLGGTIGVDRDVLYSLSTDNGATWTPPMALNTTATTDAGDDSRPQLVTDGEGHWVAIWDSDDDLGVTIGGDRDILFALSANDGATWTDPSPLNTNAGSDSGGDQSAQIATDGAGLWLAVWDSVENVGGTIGIDSDILVSQSTDHGASWSAPAPLNSNATGDIGFDVYPQITTDGFGNWMVVWVSTEDLGGTLGTDFDVLYALSNDGGTSWTELAPLNTNAAFDALNDVQPHVVATSGGAWIAVWESFDSLGGTIDTDADIILSYSTDAGGSWSEPAPLNSYAATDSGADVGPQVTAAGSDRWLVVWSSSESFGGELGIDDDILISRLKLFDADCDCNGVPDACDIANCTGAPACSDCNANGVPDGCDIAAGEPDTNGDGVPDVCEYSAPAPPIFPWGEPKTNRYLRFIAQQYVGGDPRDEVIRVRSVSLDGFPLADPDVLYLGPPITATEEDSTQPGLTFTAAPLQCDPYVHGWSAEGIISAYGAEIMPGSVYEVQRAGADCVDLVNREVCWSAPLVIETGKYGDVWPLYDAPGNPPQPDFNDIAALVNKFLAAGAAVAPIKAMAQLQPNCVSPDRAIDFRDIADDVQAFLETPYASMQYGPCACPSTVTCEATMCGNDLGCVGFGDGLCIHGYCTDPCGRCTP